MRKLTYWLTLPLLAPVLLLQGKQVRRNIPKLPEPAGLRSGIDGAGSKLRLLVLGDSAAAGVGVAHVQQSLCGHLVNSLQSHFQVDWRLLAKTGANTADAIQWLELLPCEKFDLVVTSLGVNDVTRGLGVSRWLKQQRRLRYLLLDKFSASQIIVSSLPPVGRFPALPSPLRWYLGKRAEHFSFRLRRDLAVAANCHFLPLEFDLPASAMATDGFHPGLAVYAQWAREVLSIAQLRPSALLKSSV